MLSHEHKTRILARLRKECELYSVVPRLIEEIVDEANYSLDAGFVRSEDPDEMLRHRERMHHAEGIRQITIDLTKRYGEIYQDVIREATTQHVIDDMGRVPGKSDYEDKNFWPKWKRKNRRKN